MRALTDLGAPLLAGLSRKSSVARLTGSDGDDRVFGSIALALAAVREGASLLRVHDVKATLDAGSPKVKLLYRDDLGLKQKIETVAKEIYRAGRVVFISSAARALADFERLGYGALPVCIAKVPGSLSDDPKLHGRPRDFDVMVRELRVNAGAGLVVVLTGDVLRMPGLPKRPLAERIDLVDGEVVGLE